MKERVEFNVPLDTDRSVFNLFQLFSQPSWRMLTHDQ